MINITKKVLLSILALGTLISVATISANKVLADDTTFQNPIISRIAEKFNLNEDDVQAVFDAVHEEHRTQMQEQHEERLNLAVTDGVINEEQKQALLEKQQEMWQNRQQKKEEHHEEMDAWFEENGIDHNALMQYMGGFEGGPKGFHHRF